MNNKNTSSKRIAGACWNWFSFDTVNKIWHRRDRHVRQFTDRCFCARSGHIVPPKRAVTHRSAVDTFHGLAAVSSVTRTRFVRKNRSLQHDSPFNLDLRPGQTTDVWYRHTRDRPYCNRSELAVRRGSIKRFARSVGFQRCFYFIFVGLVGLPAALTPASRRPSSKTIFRRYRKRPSSDQTDTCYGKVTNGEPAELIAEIFNVWCASTVRRIVVFSDFIAVTAVRGCETSSPGR